MGADRRRPFVFVGTFVIKLTKGSLEAEVANAVVKFHREQQGRGPSEVRAHLAGDSILVRCMGVFTQTEQKLCTTDDGRKLIRSARQELRSIHHREIEQIVANIAGCEVLRSYCDMDPESAEQVEVYILEADIEKRLLKQDLEELRGLAPRR